MAILIYTTFILLCVLLVVIGGPAGVPRECVRGKEGVRCCWAVNQTTDDSGESYASVRVCDGILHPKESQSSQQSNESGNQQNQANGGQEIPETGPMSAERIFWFNNNLNINNNNQVTLDLKIKNVGRRKFRGLF